MKWWMPKPKYLRHVDIQGTTFVEMKDNINTEMLIFSVSPFIE